MKLQVDGPDGKTYEIEGDGDPAALADKFATDMGWSSGNTDINRARVAGTGAVQGVTDVARLPYQMAQGVDWLLGQFGPEMKKAAEERRAFRRENLPSVTDFVENKIGLPTDPEAEAQRLGVAMDPNMRAIVSGTRTAAGTLAMGAGPVGALSSGIGAGLGQHIGGDTGELVGALAGPLVATGIERALVARAARNSVPVTRAVLDAGEQNFNAARATNSAVTQRSFQNFEQSVNAALPQPSALSANVRPQTMSAVADIQKLSAQPFVTIPELHDLRKTIIAPLGTASAEDAHFLQIMRRQLDSYLAGLKQVDAQYGNVARASDYLRAGIADWARGSASKELEQLVEAARNRSGSYLTGRALDQALRVEFRKIANNPTELRRFSPPVQQAIKQVSNGTPLRNVFSFLGRFSPTKVIPGMALGATVAANPAVGVPLAGVTYGASKIAGQMGLAAAARAAALARAPYAVPPLPLSRLLARPAATAGYYLSR